MITVEEIKKLNMDDLALEIEKGRKELHLLSTRHALDPLKNAMKIRKQRRQIARLLTFFNQQKKG